MNREEQKRNQPKNGKLIGLAIMLLITMPQLAIILGMFVGIFYVIKRSVQNKTQNGQPVFELSKLEQPSFGKMRQSDFDDCPKGLFCFHRDRGEHHVARGREIDPWDRPDIDIRKYQRRG